ncbi:SRPBCC domain-containing protein [Leifsonia sp. NPDC080035]|uniref:SRPBCC domain-containing protein n=1 Tax=Leifsonia sp. NPDC080035 TaxID=3143936 RepID=A0AAU7GBK2_9MICO
MTGATTVTRDGRTLTLERVFAASPDRLWHALTDPDELMRWWGPPGYPVVHCTTDVRPGGVWHYCLRGLRTGREVWARAVYQDVVPPERLTYLECSSTPTGEITDERPGAFGTITLAPDGHGARFRAVLRWVDDLDRDRALRAGVAEGFSAALDLLQTHLDEAGSPHGPTDRPTP